jgi:hypothetical protein
MANNHLKAYAAVATATTQLPTTQAFLLVLLLGGGLTVQLWRVVTYAVKHTALHMGTTAWLGVLRLEVVTFSSWARGFSTPLGELLFVSCVVLAQVCMILNVTMYASDSLHVLSQYVKCVVLESSEFCPGLCEVCTLIVCLRAHARSMMVVVL